VTISDSCGARLGRVFHVYRGSRHPIAKAGDFVKLSVRRVAPLSKIRRGYKSKAVVIRTRAKVQKSDGSHIRFSENSVVLLKKRMTPRGKELVGPVIFGMRRHKFTSTFLGIA